MSQRDHGPDIDAMLRHLGRGDDLRNLPGTATEKIAVVRTAGARGLITWSRARGRYELTHFGWNELLPRQRFGVASLMASAAVGGLAGAAALAVLWSSADAPPRAARGQSLPASHSAEPVVRSSRPQQAMLPTIATEPDSNETPALEPPTLVVSVSDAPRAEPASTDTKEVEEKK